MKKSLDLVISSILIIISVLSGCTKTPAEAAPAVQPQESCTMTEEASCCSDPATVYINNELLVVTEWLRYKLDGQAVILDARDEKAYKQEHIKGAINVTWQQFTDMSGKKPGDKGWGVLLDKEGLSEEISKLGIDGTKPVLIYGASPTGWGEDGRIAWTLKAAGVNDVKLLNGGWDAWKKTGYPTDAAISEVKPSGYAISELDESMTVTTQYIKDNINSIKIIDARDPDEYEGAAKFGEKRVGHLPGAINIPWIKVFNDDGTMKNQKQLDELFIGYGLGKNDQIAVYCTKGIRSAHLTLVLRMAGYNNARNYDASFYEWSGADGLPLEK